MSDAALRDLERRRLLDDGLWKHIRGVHCRNKGHPLTAEWTSRGPRYMHPHGRWLGCHCGARMVKVQP